jgi:enamine deaminase RidA (YjgF/YER057c/UK114 family)
MRRPATLENLGKIRCRPEIIQFFNILEVTMSLKRLGDPSVISDAVIHNNIVYLAGQVAEDPVSPSVYEQTKNILAQIDALLKQAGTDKTKIIKTNIWLSDISTFQDMNKAWKEWVVKGEAPARATVEAKLADPKWKVEIMMTAAI